MAQTPASDPSQYGRDALWQQSLYLRASGQFFSIELFWIIGHALERLAMRDKANPDDIAAHRNVPDPATRRCDDADARQVRMADILINPLCSFPIPKQGVVIHLRIVLTTPNSGANHGTLTTTYSPSPMHIQLCVYPAHRGNLDAGHAPTVSLT